ncbi:regulator of G-protein signaling 22 [Pipistrellus kuhlii]|uniref:Regulator of G protein signaling 22 n=2 Tax=Pipistrellus kuhlii TaxID=59472 RepID=A0A7J7VN95_PIPKU|nr:regulator of G-protein signaling 22 [Pipistrellus kuhlii]KAF6326642.1 regulator of G protein signaling 22 [Pipistrellus kuhlii]
MPEKRLTAEPPTLTEADFEDSLATDDFLVDYFNEFLSLPTFTEAIRFNVNYGVFEVVNNAPQLLEKQLKKILQSQQPRNPIYDVVRKAKNDTNPAQTSAPSPAETINISYSVMCLNREQGIQWIKKERLPAFLESDCYFEYRLAKLVSQVRWSKSGMNVTLDTTFSPWVMRKVPTPPPPVIEDDNTVIMKKFYISLGEASYSDTKDWFALAKQSEQTVSTFPALHSKVETPYITSVSESVIFDDGVHPRKKKDSSKATRSISEVEEEAEEGSVALPDTPSHALLRIYLEKLPDAERRTFHFATYEEFLMSYINFILVLVLNQILDEPISEGPGYVDFNNITEVIVDEFEPAPEKKDVSPETTLPKKEKAAQEERFEEADSMLDSAGSEIRADWCLSHKTYDIGNRKEFERFKTFMKGTLGERYWWLWMDIERLKVLKDTGRHQRHLEKMKKNYLVSSGDCYLSTEILTKLKLLDGSQWNKAHLMNIQAEVVKPILLYWAPRFCVTHSSAIKHASAELKLWHRRQENPRKDIDPFPQIATLLPLRPKSCIPQISDTEKEESSLVPPPKYPKKPSSATQRPWKDETWHSVSPKDSVTEKGSRQMLERSQVFRLTSYTDISECLKPELNRRFTYSEEPLVKTMADGALGGYDMENLLQSLYVENRAGFFFTKFCEHSGNELWKNSVYFWFDLQAYHQLFYQETLHPFKVCKQAQLLFATYIAPSATLDIGLQQPKKKEIYMKIQPPFEDLFDTAEEYILLLLLEPWTKMVQLDQLAYRQVRLMEETRYLDSIYFRKLQALHKETFFKKAEDVPSVIGLGISPPPAVSKPTEKWSAVPAEYKNFNFNNLLNNRLEFEHFRQFLETYSASIDLSCWTDIEQFRRIPYKDRKLREAKSIYIKNKYLNKTYFFGPNSPASPRQQDQIMSLSGGWGKTLHEQLEPPVFVEVQKHVLRRLENVWLPMFLASEQFAARQKIKLQLRDVADELILQKHERKIGIWKPVESKWIASSSEIIAFRKALLNPVTAKQFQRFVALKGDLLENGVLFWQEVQKYKDLCHSHCEESIIHKKVMTIINCFINSSVPPTLQIDIPVEQAQKIIEHRKELGPYVFREAQMTIFGVLFKFWPQFCEFRKNLTDEKIMSALERRKEYVRQKKRSTLIEEERLAKEGFKQPESVPGITLTPSDLLNDPSLILHAYGRQPTWCYSKYIEALEQERILLKVQEEVEKKLFTGAFSLTNIRLNASSLSLRRTLSSQSTQK